MTIQEGDIWLAITGNAQVQALIGSGDQARLYPGALPGEVVLPAVSYQLVSSPRRGAMTQTGSPLRLSRYRWNCFAREYDTAVEVANAIARAAGGAFNGWVDDESDRRETNTGLFRRRLETLAWMSTPEATP